MEHGPETDGLPHEVLSLQDIIDNVPRPNADAVRSFLQTGSHDLVRYIEHAADVLTYLDPEDSRLLEADLAHIEPGEIGSMNRIVAEDMDRAVLGGLARLHVKEQRLAVKQCVSESSRDQFVALVPDALPWYQAHPYDGGKQAKPPESKSSFSIAVTERLFELLDETDDPDEKTQLVIAYSQGLARISSSFAREGSSKKAALDVVLDEVGDKPELAGVFFGLIIEQERDPGLLDYLLKKTGDRGRDGAAEVMSEIVPWLWREEAMDEIKLPSMKVLTDKADQIMKTWLGITGGPDRRSLGDISSRVLELASRLRSRDEVRSEKGHKITDVPEAFGRILTELENQDRDIGTAREVLPFLEAIAMLQEHIKPPEKRRNIQPKSGGRSQDPVIERITQQHGPVGAYFLSRRSGSGRFT